MFGPPSLAKLILIAAVIAAIWYFFKRSQAARRGGGGNQTGQAGRKQSANQSGAKEAKPIEDMIQCGACGAYFPAKSRCSCGR